MPHAFLELAVVQVGEALAVLGIDLAERAKRDAADHAGGDALGLFAVHGLDGQKQRRRARVDELGVGVGWVERALGGATEKLGGFDDHVLQVHGVLSFYSWGMTCRIRASESRPNSTAPLTETAS